MKDFTEQFISGEEVYGGGFLHVHRDIVRLPDGSQTAREYIRHPGAVGIVALPGDGSVLLVRQHRYPHRRDFIEIPAGKLEPDEPALDTGKRELLEETGYVAAKWTKLGVIHNAIAYSDEAIEVWFARGLTAGERRLDAGEFLDLHIATLAELEQACAEGAVTDGKTLVGLLWLQNWHAGRWPLNWQGVA